MMNKKGNFSAFKLFYDEFIYKQNSSVAYAKIDDNISNIRDLTFKIRKMPKYNVNSYMDSLDLVNQKLREELKKILELNRSLFEYYYLLYKSKVENCNDKIEDMPFVISCSFYDDYRLDNKSQEEMESNSNVVPKYSSLEKKDIRSKAKNKTRFEFFFELISNGENAKRYDKMVYKINDLIAMKPLFNESHFDYFCRIEDYLKDFDELAKKIEIKAKKCVDYERISDQMFIAYRMRFDNWSLQLRELIIEYFDEVYKRTQKEYSVKKLVNGGNRISFETYLEIVDELIKEKGTYMNLFLKNKFKPVVLEDNHDYTKFKEVLVNSFFDKRYINNINEDSSLKECVERALELYRLADDLNDQIFERIIFEASHSDRLGRNGDVKSALITKIYDLYNPVYLLKNYEDVRKEFEKVILGKGFEFKRDYNSMLVDKKRLYGFHGPIPTMAFIRMKVVERKKSFILEQCLTELRSRDLLGNYDTRNYDLTVMTRDISIEDMISLYEKMKYKIANFNFGNDDAEKNLYLEAAQEFIVNDLFEKLEYNADTLEEKIKLYIHICDDYLNENLIFVEYEFTDFNTKRLESYKRSRNDFKKKSKWAKFMKEHK